ncbi:MAG: hypothetical protein ACAH11_03620 [Sphingomonas sp.]
MRWLIALLFAFVTFPAAAQTTPWQPQYFAVGIADDSGIGGVISYRIGADGKLDGRFALHGSDGRIEREMATPRKRGALAGTYDTRGVSQGEAYTGVLTIAPIGRASGGEGELYRLSWDNGDRGVAIRSGQMLTVAFGQNGDTVGMLFSTAPGEWSVVAIGWRDGAERRVGLSWTGELAEGNHWVRPLAGGPREQLRLAPNGATWRLYFDDGNYGVAMPVAAPPLKLGG